ncbi:hypothetical protein GCM10010402_64780 [Actinomadura luteofluorescens]
MTTASAIPIANQAKYRGSQTPIPVCRSGTNIRTVHGSDSAAYTPIPTRSRLARTPGSPLRVRRAYQERAVAVNGSSTYQPASTTRLHICPSCAGPRSPFHHGSGR